jgi:4-aminobutyrate aminotransferase
VVRRGAGCIIEDVDGNRFLDFNAGIAVTVAGHAHPAVNATIHAQVDDVLNMDANVSSPGPVTATTRPFWS